MTLRQIAGGNGHELALLSAVARPLLSSAATFVETSIVIESRYGAEGLRDLGLFLTKAGVDIVPVDSDQALVARRAFARFGKGRHRAGLNVGDCFSYPLATTPLLFKGDDFVHTDVGATLLR